MRTRWSWSPAGSKPPGRSPPWKPLPLAGMRQIWRRFSSARGAGAFGDYTYFMSLEDLEGMLEVVISGEVYRRSRKAFSNAGPYVLEGVVELDASNAEPFIRAERVWGLG